MADPVVSQAAQAALDDQGQAAGGTQTPASVEVPEYLSGNVTAEQYAKWTPEQQTWAKELYGDYTRKNQEVAELRKVQEQLDANPDLADALSQVVKNPELAKAILKGELPTKPTATERAAKDELDDALEEATPKQRELIQSLIKRAAKEAVSVSQAKITELEQTIKTLINDTAASRRQELEASVGALTGHIKALAEKHRPALFRVGGLQGYKEMSVRKLLQIVAGDEEYDLAVIADAPEAAKKQMKKVLETSTAKPQATVGSVETAEPARMPSRDARFKKGALNVGDLIRNVHETVKKGMGVG